MRNTYRFATYGLLSCLAFSTVTCSNDTTAGCAAGTEACNGACIPTGTSCTGNPDLGTPDNPDLSVVAAPSTALVSLTVSDGALSPAFAPQTLGYTATVLFDAASVRLTPTAENPAATIEVNGIAVASGMASGPIMINAGPAPTMVTVVIRYPTLPDRSYTVALTAHAVDYFKAATPDPDDRFGHSVALSGDTLAVGVLREDSGALGVNGNAADNTASNSGAVYVYVLNGGTWTQQAYLKASVSSGSFGNSVALAGDTLVVGAPGETNSTGATYVYTRSGTAWTQQARLVAASADTGDLFGSTVALSGDTLAVGAANEDSNATGVNGTAANNMAADSGAVYVFTRSGTAWTQQAYIKASNTEANDLFSTGLALSGDTLAVGATGEDSNATGENGDQANNGLSAAGAVYVFTRSGTAWTQQSYLKAQAPAAAAAFGGGVALAADTLAVGGDTGGVHVYKRGGTVWTREATVARNTRVVSLGSDLLALGILGDSSTATGIGGNPDLTGATNSGAAFLYQRSGAQWTQRSYIKATNTGAGDRFGSALSLSGSRLAVGAYAEDSSATTINGDANNDGRQDSGAAYVYR